MNDLTTANFASPDFPDAFETSLSYYPLDSYSTTLNNCVIQHLNEIKDKNISNNNIFLIGRFGLLPLIYMANAFLNFYFEL